MITKNFTFIRNDSKCSGVADFFEKNDLSMLNEAYFAWKALNETYTKYHVRRATFPELISEGLTSALFEYARTNNNTISGMSSSSCDLIDIKNGVTIQLKACSTDSKHNPGPTSFGPRSEFDKLIFMHIDCDKDTAYFYELDADEYENWNVNRRETIKDQQAQGRRPRLTILPKIKQYNIQPYYTYKFTK